MTANLTTRTVIILAILALSGFILWKGEVNLGIDLRGGSILTYKVQPLDKDDQVTAQVSGDIDARQVEDTVAVISQRINKEGVKDIQVRREGSDLITIYLPGMTKAQSDQIRSRMEQVGELLMAIQASDGDRAGGVTFNQRQMDEQRKTILKEHFADANKPPYVPPDGFRWFPIRPQRGEKESKAAYNDRVTEYERQLREEPWEVEGSWMFFDPIFWDKNQAQRENPGFTGRDIYDPIRSFDRQGGLAVAYKVREERQNDMAAYSQKFVKRPMALVLNGEIWSTATIQEVLRDNVQISGGATGFTEQEQSWLINCLQAGSLKLRPILLSQEEIGATLGAKSIDRGYIAFAIGGVLILVFMLLYYKISGLLAVIALAANFLMIMGVLILLDASLTLPGIAGLVLTVGMAVDANILIFERIREEMAKGKTVMQAAKNGFDRAFVTIFDANLTTFIVAAFLVTYGKGPIKGFGYTLMTGIVCSMFAALYITRTLMGWCLSKGLLADVNFMQLVKKTSIAFTGMAKRAMTVSAIIIAVGLVFFFITPNHTKYGLDFNGGTSVRLHFKDFKSDAAVRTAVTAIQDADGNQKYKFPEATTVRPDSDTETNSDGATRFVELKLDYVVDEAALSASGDDGEESEDLYAAIEAELQNTFKGELVEQSITAKQYDPNTQAYTAVLTLLTPYSDLATLKKYAVEAGLANATVTALDGNNTRFQVSGTALPEVQESIGNAFTLALSKVQGVELSNPFPKVRFLGPNVVSDLKSSAIQAMIVSLLFILGYIWFRFKEIKYGVAAAAALVHDVLISLGMVCLINSTGIVSVPISLNVIAAFLTIIGYSLNDTIVVFDRIRENLGNVKGTFGEVVDRSINQTLSRTVLTSITTFVVVGVVFFTNYGIESPLEGLTFTLMIGVVVGTYSSIFVASPVLTWLNNREERQAQAAKGTPKAKVAKA